MSFVYKRRSNLNKRLTKICKTPERSDRYAPQLSYFLQFLWGGYFVLINLPLLLFFIVFSYFFLSVREAIFDCFLSYFPPDPVD